MSLFIYAEAIRRADASWRAWDQHRKSRRKLPPQEDPKRWRYPRSRGLLFRLQDALIACGLFRDELVRLASREAEDAPCQPPGIDADDRTWLRVLEERWLNVVRNAHSRSSHVSRLDGYHISRDRAMRAIGLLRAATALAGDELDAGEPSPLKRYTTRFTAFVDVLHDALPSVGRYGHRVPPDLEAIAQRIGEAFHAFVPYETELRTLAYQPLSNDAMDHLESPSGSLRSERVTTLERYEPASWFLKDTTGWLRKASAPGRKMKVVRKRMEGLTQTYCVADVRRWRPDLIPADD